MSTEHKCPDCGAPLPKDAPKGLCPECLLGAALEAPPTAEKSDTEDQLPDDQPSRRIGRYKLLQKLGEGGCGVVYMAEQSEPIRRRVALKIIKLGMDTRQVIARFEAERQALALMDHPNIAKVLDAGATESGRPYFVMELVKGTRITSYCDDNQLSTIERLRLFTQVCQAIQHAHQKGVIHRDIKPSNILVTLHDGAPVPKVIDFGIAKAIERPLTEKTVFTALGQFMGTPAYMSPEQAELSGLDLDTRSDIYALGVLLYELLTGRTPFDTKELLKAGLDEMRRRIREEEPVRPSTRLSTMLKADLTEVAQRRQSDPAKLARFIRGELDWIVMRCLEKDRNRRYETANGLAMDIRRYLNREPVVAFPPSNFYRFRKLIRRNRAAFLAGTAVTVSLVAGLTASLVLYMRARDEAAISKAVNEFLQNDLLRQASSEAQADAHFDANPGLTVREALLRADQVIGERFRNQPLVEAAVRAVIGEALSEVGEHDHSILELQEALKIRKAELGPKHSQTLATMNTLGLAYQKAGRITECLLLLEEARRLQLAKSGPGHQDSITPINNLGLAYIAAGKYAEALALFQDAYAWSSAKLGPDHPQTLATMHNLAAAKLSVGDMAGALLLFQDTLKLQTVKLGPEHPRTLTTMDNLANLYTETGDLQKSVLLLQKDLEVRKARMGQDHPDTLQTMNNLALAYRAAGNTEQALSLLEETLRLRRAKLGSNHPDTLITMNNLASIYSDTGKLDQAIALLEENLKVKTAKLGPNHPSTLTTANNLAGAYQQAGRFNQAILIFEENLKSVKAQFGPEHPRALVATHNLGRAYYDAGCLEQALPILETALELHQAKLGPDHPGTLSTMNSLAEACQAFGRLDQALPLFEETLRLRTAKLGADHPNTLNTGADLADAFQVTGKLDLAQVLFEETARVRTAKLGAEHIDTLESLEGLASCFLQRSNFASAEPLLYSCLQLRQKKMPDDWHTCSVQIRLGMAYLGERRFEKAEQLLLQGYSCLKRREQNIPAASRQIIQTAGQSLLKLYGDWEKPEQAAAWRVQIEANDAPQQNFGRNAGGPVPANSSMH